MVPAVGRRLVAIALFLPLVACAETLDDARPCAPDGCAQGEACVIGRCRPTDSAPAPTETSRIILEPVAMAVAASGAKGGGGEDLPDAVALGRASSGTVALFLRFASTWRDDAEVTRAILVLTPMKGSTVASAPTSIQVARILEPWSPSTVTWGRQPRTDAPLLTSSRPLLSTAPLRVDVTAIVRDWALRSKEDRGVALVASGQDAFGVDYAMGLGRGPRLEAYVR